MLGNRGVEMINMRKWPVGSWNSTAFGDQFLNQGGYTGIGKDGHLSCDSYLRLPMLPVDVC